jgi:hypothetical protein
VLLILNAVVEFAIFGTLALALASIFRMGAELIGAR